MVGDAVLLLEGALVLLVDDDDAEIGIRQKQRRTRPDHPRSMAVGNRPPGGPPLRRGEVGVPQRRRHPDAPLETLPPLRRQREPRPQQSETRRGRKECCRKCTTRWAAEQKKKK